MFFDILRKLVRKFKDHLSKERKEREKEIEDLKEKFERHEELFKKQDEMINNLKKALIKKTKKLKTLVQKVDEQECVLKELTTKNKKQKRQVTKKCDDASKNAECSIQIVNEVIQNSACPYTWQLNNFSGKRKQAKFKERLTMLKSEPFFMMSGYKAQLLLFPNGADENINTHVSIFIKMLKGPFDEYLRWPMKGCIQLCVIDDTDEEENASYINTSQESCQHIFERPSPTGDEESKDWGFSRFIPLADLHKYLVDDTLRICVSAWSINQ